MKKYLKTIIPLLLILILIIAIVNKKTLEFAFYYLLQADKSIDIVENPLEKALARKDLQTKEREILSKYMDELEGLKKEYTSKLDLIKKSNEENSLKLIQKGSLYEEQCDEKFEYIIEKLREELRVNNYDPSIYKAVKSHYNNFKEIVRNDTISVVKN